MLTLGGFTKSLDKSVNCKVTTEMKESGFAAEREREALAKRRRGNEIFTRSSYILGGFISLGCAVGYCAPPMPVPPIQFYYVIKLGLACLYEPARQPGKLAGLQASHLGKWHIKLFPHALSIILGDNCSLC